ncbi:MAG: hypothetical protein K6E50_05660 [Lachnospiraceae bacterium]|nr:hypothetical protein [Lachnospiraceae bacterium]
MHKNDKVCNLLFNELGALVKVARVINPELLPLPAKKDISLLKEWCRDRTVPKTRHHIERLVSVNSTTGIFMLDNLGLSLNDTYWFKPFEEDYSWKDINLFDNDFSTAIISEKESVKKFPAKTRFSKYSPDATTKGDLEKKWLIKKDGTRFLVKGNFGAGCQQSLNEKFVTLINQRQNTDIPYVKYDTFEFAFGEENAICCASDNFITDDTMEFISGYDIFQSQKIRGGRSAYYQILGGCVDLGLDEALVRHFFDYEILLDYLITNTDRHFNNFGILRNADTLRVTGMAPIYDSGSCLFWSKLRPEITPGMFTDIKTHSFLEKEERLLRYVLDPQAMDISKLPDENNIHEAFAEGNVLPEERIDFIVRCFTHKRDKLESFRKTGT